jgi:hypothetical protein
MDKDSSIAAPVNDDRIVAVNAIAIEKPISVASDVKQFGQ